MAKKKFRKFQSPEYGARTLQTDRRQTDGRTTTYSERELKFTFANEYDHESETTHPTMPSQACKFKFDVIKTF